MRDGEPGAKSAKAFCDDKIGAGNEHHHAVMTANKEWLERYRGLRDHYDSLKAAGAPKAEVRHAHEELLKIKAPVMKAYSAYQKLTTETDAFATGARAGTAYAKSHGND